MSSRFLRRAAALAALLGAVLLLLSNGIPGVVGTTSAVFQGESQTGGDKFAANWVAANTNATATATGKYVTLAWTLASGVTISGQTLWGVDNGTSKDCTGAAYAQLGTNLNPTLTSSTITTVDQNPAFASTLDGHWYCYALVDNTSPSTWGGVTPLALQVGLAADALALTNGGTSNSIGNGDTIQITFNQKPSVGTTARVCAWSTAVVIGDSTGACTSSADARSIGEIDLTGATVTGAPKTFATSTVAVSAAAPWIVTVTLAGGSATAVGSGGTWQFVPSSSLVSNATPTATACTTPASNCEPTTSSNF